MRKEIRQHQGRGAPLISEGEVSQEMNAATFELCLVIKKDAMGVSLIGSASLTDHMQFSGLLPPRFSREVQQARFKAQSILGYQRHLARYIRRSLVVLLIVC